MCEDGVCVHVPAPAGSLPSEMQVQGDCKQLACDGDGNVATWGLMSDAPAEDGNPCTEGSCEKDGPKQRPRKTGSSCGEGVCTASGVCGACVPDTTKCEAAQVVRCNEQGQWTARAPCPEETPVCNAPADGPARCAAVAELGVGRAHACARFEDGTVRCWGSDHAGQLGSEGLAQARRPDWAVSYVQFDLGHEHGCGVRDDGTVWCFGANDFGQLGSGDFVSQRETQVVSLSDAAEVSVGENHSCARDNGGKVQCWGRNDLGQLGSGTAPKAQLASARAPVRGNLRARPALISGVNDATRIHVDGDHTCVARGNGETLCFGPEEYPLPDSIEDPGEPGPVADRYKALTEASSRTAVAVTGLTDVAQIACAGDLSCARKHDGTVWCWGAGTRGQLGDGGTGNKFAPVQVEGVARAVTLGLGDGFACVVDQTGAVWCWGSNEHGRLGRGLGELRGKAALVRGIDAAQKLAVGDAFACVLTQSGRTRCWGDGVNGQLGMSHTQGSPLPAPVHW
jgi:alpha-tubulin suppressor-like RCC1 family protein